MPVLLIPISASGAADADVDFDLLRRWLTDGLIPVVRIEGVLHVRVIDLGLSPRMTSAYMGLPLASVASLIEAGILKPLPLPGAARLRKADVDAHVTALKPLPLTSELREEIWPSVETFVSTAVDDSPASGWGKAMDALDRHDTVAAARVDAEFEEWFDRQFPKPKVVADADGLERFEPVEGAPTPEQKADLRRDFHKRHHAQEEQRRSERYSRNPALG
ncbi:MAG: hypothetical protein ACYDCS_04090 [Candidatus Dormibacteria bacterium]